jgi:hypothetical protein
VRFVAVALDEIDQPFAKFADVVHRAKTRKARAAFLFEKPAFDDVINSPIGGVIVIETFTHSPEQLIFAVFNYPDATVHCRGAQIEQQTFRLKNAMCFEEGMDHAPVGHSSQGPREHRRVERPIAVTESLRRANGKANKFGKAFG